MNKASLPESEQIVKERLKKQQLDEAITIGIRQADRGEFSKRTVLDIIQHKETQNSQLDDTEFAHRNPT